ncbi:MAG: DUF2949 domain-containing protein [Chroococcidiopsidaceae cyanobacterium CP_BM_ER_R8_30]|nr:DUF2949 domain-containing protein [Chroococcidiopsidaceae cyanobacterium CP_BM_ER_R8_30]
MFAKQLIPIQHFAGDNSGSVLPPQVQLLNFLQEELAVPAAALKLALKQANEEDMSQLPMILWQYGLVTLPELEKVFDWLATL